jgi:hypothetical protein
MSDEKKHTRERTKRKISTLAKPQKVENIHTKGLMVSIDEADAPRVVTGAGIAEFVSSSSSAAAAAATETKEDALLPPPELGGLVRALKRLGPVKLAMELTAVQPSQADIIQAITCNRAFLPEMSAADVAKQLGEAGTFGDRTYAECMFGRKCQGLTAGIRVMHDTDVTVAAAAAPPVAKAKAKAVATGPGAKSSASFDDFSLAAEDRKETKAPAATAGASTVFRGAVLQAHIFPGAYDYFMSTGNWPEEKSPCILCYLSNITDVLMAMRGNPEGAILAPDVAYQAWKVVSDGEGHYDSVHLFKRIPGVKDGIYDSCLMWRPGHLFWVRTKPHGRWMVDQSALLWQAPSDTAPAVGEPLAGF